MAWGCFVFKPPPERESYALPPGGPAFSGRPALVHIDARRVVELGPGFRSAKTAPHKKILCSVNRNFELTSFGDLSEPAFLRRILEGLRAHFGGHPSFQGRDFAENS